MEISSKMESNHSLLVLISHVLSIVTILLSFFLKVPQIIRLYRQKSVTGLNFYSLIFELYRYVY